MKNIVNLNLITHEYDRHVRAYSKVKASVPPTSSGSITHHGLLQLMYYYKKFIFRSLFIVMNTFLYCLSTDKLTYTALGLAAIRSISVSVIFANQISAQQPKIHTL